MSNDSSSSEQIQIEFAPLILASEPGSTLTSFMLPGEILLKIGELTSVEAMRNLVATCKYIRNQLNTWFLQALASENNPDRATSGFIVDAIGDEGDTCLWRNAKFFIEDHDIPKELSIHLFANTTAEKISSDEVRSMIIQVSGLPSPPDLLSSSNLSNPPDLYHDVRKFLKFLFLKVSFKNLKCLMFCGIQLSDEFYQEIGTLNLDVFHMKNFRYHDDYLAYYFFLHWNSLKTLYVMHPDVDETVCPPNELKKLVIYCPKSSKDIIEGRKVVWNGLWINVEECHALKEM